MVSPELQNVIEQTNQLTAEEQLHLIAHLANHVRNNSHTQAKKRYSWQDIAGILPAHPLDEDAQAWISRTRQGGDIKRIRYEEEMA